MSRRGWFWISYVVIDLLLAWVMFAYVLPFLWAVLAWCQAHPGQVPW